MNDWMHQVGDEQIVVSVLPGYGYVSCPIGDPDEETKVIRVRVALVKLPSNQELDDLVLTLFKAEMLRTDDGILMVALDDDQKVSQLSKRDREILVLMVEDEELLDLFRQIAQGDVSVT